MSTIARIFIVACTCCVLTAPSIAKKRTPVADKQVVLEKITDGKSTMTLKSVTDPEGRFRFERLPSGTYRLTMPSTPEELKINNSAWVHPIAKKSGKKTELEVEIDIYQKTPAHPFEPLIITVGPDGGKVYGTVTKLEPLPAPAKGSRK